MDGKKAECSLRTEVVEGDTQKLSREGGVRRKRKEEDTVVGLA